MMMLETVFPPIPSEIVMPLAGLEAQRGSISLLGGILAGTAGAMAGNFFWYSLARRIGKNRFKPLVERHGRFFTLTWSEIERGDRLFDRYDRWFVCLGRMVPTIRSLVSIPAGLFEMRALPFLLWSTTGTLGWTALLATAGYMLGDQYAAVGRYLNPASNVVLALLIGGYLYRVATWKPR
ncbi:DedA family protein [Parasphingopyxis sp. GrpM-11]|uniref:DedA family protein n=2 Tax=Parasphingopyxis marina TaxID=2761622 RepID=A0A842HZ83_9SPHN|nr:DedA family protein [Parasphingopyxis marina]